MMRIGVVLAVAALGVACSSSSSGPECTIEGSYSGSGTIRPGGTCPAGSNEPVTDTITAGGSSGHDFTLQITGLAGACYLDRVAGSACKVQGKCDLVITDALSPANNVGTVQYAWTFTDKGFSGTSTVSLPPANGLPNGCGDQADVTGTRQ